MLELIDKYKTRLWHLQEELKRCTSPGGTKVLQGRIAMLEEVIQDLEDLERGV